MTTLPNSLDSLHSTWNVHAVKPSQHCSIPTADTSWRSLPVQKCLSTPLVSITKSLGRHLKRCGQLKHSFSGAFGEERVQEVRDTCYFPTGATLRICQSRVSGNDSKKKDGKRSRSGRQRPGFTAKAWDQWIAGVRTLHPQTPAHKQMYSTHTKNHLAQIDLFGACQSLEKDNINILRWSESHINK